MLPQLFKPFEQGARKQQFGGLGLGLAIASEMHAGSIEVMSEGIGKGATFAVNLPDLSC